MGCVGMDSRFAVEQTAAADWSMLVAASADGHHPSQAVSKLRVLRMVGRRGLPTLIAANEPLWTWPSHSPIGNPIATAIPIPIPAIVSVSRVRWVRVGNGGGPGICPLRPMNLNASTKTFISAPSSRG